LEINMKRIPNYAQIRRYYEELGRDPSLARHEVLIISRSGVISIAEWNSPLERPEDSFWESY
jgi:hypothetical protein